MPGVQGGVLSSLTTTDVAVLGVFAPYFAPLPDSPSAVPLARALGTQPPLRCASASGPRFSSSVRLADAVLRLSCVQRRVRHTRLSLFELEEGAVEFFGKLRTGPVELEPQGWVVLHELTRGMPGLQRVAPNAFQPPPFMYQ